MPSGSTRWRPSAWRELLRLILPFIEAAPERLAFSFGGGTALAQHLHHRVSYDVDLFFESSRALRLLSPQRNAALRVAIGGKWQEPGHYLKFELPDGEIDLLVTYPVTDEPTEPYDFEGRILEIERPREILGKKIRYRGPAFKRRDVFDLAATLTWAPDEVSALVPMVRDRVPLLIDRIAAMSDDYRAHAGDDINPTEQGRTILHDAPEICLRGLEGWVRRG